jgi:uncharacterized protein YaiI (UPF0178 family)
MLDLYVAVDAHAVYQQTLRAAQRYSLDLFLVTRDYLHCDANVHLIIAEEGRGDGAAWITANISGGDICITADIRLAGASVARGAVALSPTGRAWNGDFAGGMTDPRASNGQQPSSGSAGRWAPEARAFAQQLETAIVATRAANPRSLASRVRPSSGVGASGGWPVPSGAAVG